MTRTLTGVLWNVEHGRHQAAVRRDLAELLAHKPAFAVLNEAQGYIGILSDVAGYTLVAPGKGQRNAVILVHDDVRHGPGFMARMTLRGWVTARGRRTPPKTAATVELDGWLRVVGVHLPPSVHWTKGHPRGPVRRIAAYAGHQRHLLGWLRRHRGPVVVPADWNAVPTERGRWTPRWLASKAHGHLAHTRQPTHGRRCIDFVLARGCSVVDLERGPKYGSDHHSVRFTVKEHA